MSIWIQISAGQGPEECCWVVGQLATVIENFVSSEGLSIDRIEEIAAANKNTFHSVVLSFDSDALTPSLNAWIGTVQWIGKSPFRPNHGRKNWFVDVSVLPLAEPTQWKLDEKELKFEAYRSSGKGGQNVNKVSTAVRLTHLPTGITATAQDERSQLRNRNLALERLKLILIAKESQARANRKDFLWRQHHKLERGNAVKVFSGPDFREK
ncbi:MAG: peptide chain release factor H [Candidatus Obscuribacterales bacterium]|nr:peptide chain release factor H [Candidatus Obscuribacterales bacterium]